MGKGWLDPEGFKKSDPDPDKNHPNPQYFPKLRK
jgi:hypothetical protein